MSKRNSEQRDNLNSSLSFLDDSVYIADQYYQNKPTKLNQLTSSFDKTNENKNGRQVEYVPLDIVESKKKSIYKEYYNYSRKNQNFFCFKFCLNIYIK
jgi:hypothetical protein